MAALGALAGIVVLVVLAMSAMERAETGVAGTGTRQPTEAAERTAATAGPLYRTGALSPLGCPLPAITPDSDASMLRFMNRLSSCLDDTWKRQFAKAEGLRFSAPARAFWTRPGRSPCGSYPQPGASAFYCPANDTMYIGLRDIITTAGNEPVSNFAVYARVVAHEYGHHVQNRAGILPYGHRLMDEQPSAGDRNRTSRRIELQAQCFAGAFLGAERASLPMTRRQYDVMIADVRGRGDDRLPPEKRDHGSSRTYAGWVIRGYRMQTLASCNTWTARTSAVD